MYNYAKRVEELHVFEKAYNISLSIHKISLEFPKIEQYALANQIRRASKLVCANLAEGFAKQAGSRREFRHFILTSMGSSDEMQIWIRYCKDLLYITNEQEKLFSNEYQ